MNFEQIYEIRKKLLEWKRNPKQTITLLKELEKNEFEEEALHKSKIIKTLNTLCTIEDKDNNVTQDQLDQIKFKAEQLARKIRRIFKKEKEEKKQQKPQNRITTKEQQEQNKDSIKQIASSKSLPDIDLFYNYKDPYPSFVDRQKYLRGLSRQMISNLQTYWAMEPLSVEQLQVIKSVVEQMEKQIYYGKQGRVDARKLYEQDLRTLGQYLKRDKNGAVTYRLYSKQFDPVIAAELKASDWIDDQTKEYQQQCLKEKMEAEQIGFYKQLSKREMEGVDGKKCKGCGEKKVYLVDEKQTRASDEPTTKFFECYNCGDKFRIC